MLNHNNTVIMDGMRIRTHNRTCIRYVPDELTRQLMIQEFPGQREALSVERVPFSCVIERSTEVVLVIMRHDELD